MHVKLPSGKIGVAVSGGIDSMVMLDIMLKIGADVTVINIEHGIRGAESKKDSDFVISYCKQKDIKYLFFSIDAVQESKKRKQSIELCARNLRYEIFNEILNDKTVDYIALGHHADDNAETILMRILRGTGVRGLKGIVDNNGFIHPLITYGRKQIEEYATKKNIPFVTDSTNNQSDYTRNFLRNDVIKVLQKRFKNLNESFSRLAENAIQADDYLMANTLTIYGGEQEPFILLEDFNNAHRIIKQYTLLKLFCGMGVHQDIESKHYDYIIELADKENNTEINLPFNIMAIREYDKIVFYYNRVPQRFYQKLDYNKSYVFCGSRFSFASTEKIRKGVTFDSNKIPKNAVLRNRKQGDVFQKYGGGTKKLNDYLTDIKMPKRQRNDLLVIASGDDVLMLCGIEISEKIKVDNNTKEILYIKKEIL